MAENYYTIATKRGKEKIQDYYRQNKTLPLTHMGFGGVDGDDANYQRPNVEMTIVPNEWARIGLERKPDEGFIGGGATIENKVDEYKGKWICNVGIYDEDGELILISAYRPLLVDPEESIVSSYPINIQSVLANAEHVVVQTDTSITHPTHDEMNQALEELDNKLSKYATTDAAGLIELATPQEVSAGEDAKRAVTPATLKPELDEIKELINESEGSLSQPATTERLGLTELATQQEVDQRTGGEQVVTAQTLDKPGLISFLQRYADEEVKKLKELIFGGNPSSALDTLFELANAYESADDAIQNIINTLSTKLPTATFTTFQTGYNQWKSQIQTQVNRKWEAVDGTTARKGIVQLTAAVNSTSQTLAANAAGLKAAYDKAVSAYNLANDKWTAVNASPTVKGIVNVIDSTTSKNVTDAATPNSVRLVNQELQRVKLYDQPFDGRLGMIGEWHAAPDEWYEYTINGNDETPAHLTMPANTVSFSLKVKRSTLSDRYVTVQFWSGDEFVGSDDVYTGGCRTYPVARNVTRIRFKIARGGSDLHGYFEIGTVLIRPGFRS